MSDVLPPNRPKRIHSVGLVAPIAFNSFRDRHNYTGLFKGARYGVLRVSSAAEPETSKTVGDITPGGGFKFFRDSGEGAARTQRSP